MPELRQRGPEVGVQEVIPPVLANLVDCDYSLHKEKC
jgi:hypothetical protein